MIGKIFLSALDFNGLIAVRLFILSHFTYVKGIGLYLQRTASAFGCVLGGLTGDRLWWAGESGFKRQESVDSRDEICLVCSINRLQI